MQDITLCTRSVATGEMKMVDRSVLFSRWEYDLLIFGTKEKEYLLNFENTKGIKGSRVVFDLSVPRNVDPRIQKHPDITLMNIDQLSELLEKKRRAQLLELQSSENVIRSLVDRQIGIYQSKRRVFALVS
jgi:glutamyl-tRNA reductase